MKSDISVENILLISVKPEFAEKIMVGEKTIELRKSTPKRVDKENYILIYVTSPIKELWGICKINNLIKEDKKNFWSKYGSKTGITKQQFNEYYKTNKKKSFSNGLKKLTTYKDERSINHPRVNKKDFS